MGKAFILSGVSFAGSSFGRITPQIPVPLLSITINGPSSIQAPTTTGRYTVVYNPSNTTETGVIWSVVSGRDIASIDSAGLLSVTGTGSVVIRATSSYDNTIYAEKSIQTSAYVPIEDLTNRLNFPKSGGYIVTDIVLAAGDYIKIKFARLSIPSVGIGFYVGSRQLSNADNDTTSIETDSAGKLVVKLFGKKFTSANSVTLNTRYVITAKGSGITCEPSLGVFTQTTYTFNQAYPLCVDGILYANNQVGYNGTIGDLFGFEVYGSDGTIKHRLIPQSDLTLLDEVTSQVYSKTGGGTINFGTD